MATKPRQPDLKTISELLPEAVCICILHSIFPI